MKYWKSKDRMWDVGSERIHGTGIKQEWDVGSKIYNTNMSYKKVIKFTDLDVYQRLYNLAIRVHKELLPKLPKEEKYILINQLSRSTKSPPALIAEAYARRYSGKEWRKYIREAIGECNEIIVHLSFAKDLYPKQVNIDFCNNLIEEYEISGKQLFRLGESWRG